MAAERLQKLLAAAGYGSRRSSEDYITAGRVRVNGQVAHLGDKADPATDKITVDGELLAAESLVYIMLNKPRGVISSLESQGERDTVRDLVNVPQRVYPVGRLDVLSEGLVLLTNDGDLTNQLTHPRYGHEKEYSVFVLGEVDRELLRAWSRGIVIKDEDGNSEQTAPAQVEVDNHASGGTWLKVVMREGKKHQIRRVAETLGLQVARLIRVRMGSLLLGALRPGVSRPLTPAEVRALKTPTTSAPKGRARPHNKFRPKSQSNADSESRPRTKSYSRPDSSSPKPRRPSGPNSKPSQRNPSGRPSSGRPSSGRPPSGKPPSRRR